MGNAIRLRQLAVAPRTAGDGIMAILKAYFDDSGDGASFALAGYIGADRAWKIFEPEWQSALDKHGIPYFHMKEIPDPKSPMHRFYGKQNEAKLRDLLFDLALVLGKCWNAAKFCGIGCLVPLEALDKFNQTRNRNLDPLALAIYTCAGLMQNEFPGQPVEALLDRLTKPHKSLSLSDEYAATNPRAHMRENSIIMIPAKEPVSSKSPTPATADFAAYEGRKKYHKLDPFFQKCRFEQRDDKTPMFGMNMKIGWKQTTALSTDERKIFTALGEATTMRFPIWLYEVLFRKMILRDGRWVS